MQQGQAGVTSYGIEEQPGPGQCSGQYQQQPEPAGADHRVSTVGPFSLVYVSLSFMYLSRLCISLVYPLVYPLCMPLERSQSLCIELIAIKVSYPITSELRLLEPLSFNYEIYLDT